MIRIYANYDNAVDAAHDLHYQLEIRQPVYIKTIIYGSKKEGREYEVLAESEIKSFPNSKTLKKII